jgi:hypothetical protein
MTTDETLALHQRLDRLEDKLDQIATAVTRQVAVCGLSRGKFESLCETVYGNGREGLVTRVARLETVRKFWAAAAAALAGLFSGIVVTIVAWLLGKRE